MLSRWKLAGWRLVAALLVVGLLSAPIAAQVIPHENAPWLIAKKLTVSGTTALTGNVTAANDVAVGGDLVLSPATPITVTMNATITPLGSYQALTSAGTVNTSSITVGAAGTVLTLVNSANTSIVFTDTGTLKLTGNITLGQYDTLVLVSDGTSWIQRATSNN